MKQAIPFEKISIVTDEISQDLDEVSRFLEEYDLHTLEIRTIGDKRVPEIDLKIWDDLLRRAKANAWNILVLSPGTFKGSFDDREKMEHELRVTLHYTIERAEQVGAKYIITFGFMCNPEDTVPDFVIKALGTAAELCSEAGIALLLENEPGSFADTGERTRDLLDLVGHPNLYANWDPCNSNVFDNPERLGDAARSLGLNLKHVHVKDATPEQGQLFPKYGPIKTGHIGWRKHLEVLKEMVYDGYFGIETHFGPLYEASATLLTEFRTIMREINYLGK